MLMLLIGLVIYALIVSLLLRLPMLAEFKQIILIVAVILALVYVAQFFGVFGGGYHHL